MTDPTPPTPTRHWSDNVLVKVVFIGFIILGLMIPSLMITNLVRERAGRKSMVIAEVSNKWGQTQTIAGPYITIPYIEEIKTPNGPSEWVSKTFHFFPATLNIKGEIDPVVRKRSIYKVMLYESELAINGVFDIPQLDSIEMPGANMQWEKATLHLGISDLIGINNKVVVRLDGKEHVMTASAANAIQFPSGLMTRIDGVTSESKSISYDIKLSLKGSQGLYFTPVAAHTIVSITSAWPSPAFQGQFLPDSTEVNHQGFSATWNVLDINRQIAPHWTSDAPQLLATAPNSRHVATTYPMDSYNAGRTVMGVELIDTVDHYVKNERTVKYAFLLITLTFIIYFFCEMLKKQKVHPLQYGLIGAAIVIFFILLLSFSEHIGFDASYMVASLATVMLITWYSMSIFAIKKIAWLIGVLLLVEFGFIYIILQLEDLALITGAIALFLVLALIMYLTRKVKWYSGETV